MLDSLTAAAHIKQEAARSWGLHAALNERAPWDTEVFSVEQNRTAYQTITIRPRVFWNDPLHLRLGGERQRGRWRRVCRGAGCILQTASFEVISVKSHRSNPTHSPTFALSSIPISHGCRLKLLLPILLHSFLPSSSTFSQKPPSNHRSSLPPRPVNICPASSPVCVQTAF